MKLFSKALLFVMFFWNIGNLTTFFINFKQLWILKQRTDTLDGSK